MKLFKLSVLALATCLAYPSAQAENISLRLTYSEGRSGIVFQPSHAEIGEFAVTPNRKHDNGASWRVISRNAKGVIVYETTVANGLDFNAEGFNPKTGDIEVARSVRLHSGVFEVAMPYDMDVASIEVLPNAVGKKAMLAQADGAPLAKFDRKALGETLGKSKVARINAMSTALAAAAAPVSLYASGATGARMDFVLVGDGYTAADMPKWQADASRIAQGMLANPLFVTHRNAINIWRVDVASNQSGVDEPAKGIYRDTAFDSAFDCFGVERSICVDETKVLNTLSAVTAPDGRDVVMVVSNSSRYGGAATPVTVRMSADADAPAVAMHEIGHTAFLLADEYDYGTCAAGEPGQINVTRDLSRTQTKWGSMIAGTVAIPTVPGSVQNGTVGMFKGGKYCTSGVYRPTESSIMLNIYSPWHAVNEKRANETLYKFSACPTGNTYTQGDPAFGNICMGKHIAREELCLYQPWLSKTKALTAAGWNVVSVSCANLSRFAEYKIYVTPKY